MTTSVDRPTAGPPIDDLLLLLSRTTQPRTIEFVADQLGVLGDRRASDRS